MSLTTCTTKVNGVKLFVKKYFSTHDAQAGGEAMANRGKGSRKRTFEDCTKAETVIFHHGYTSSSDVWNSLIPHIASDPRFRCVSFDCRGCGQSEKPEDVTGYNLEQYAKDVIALANTLKVDKFTYVGHSMGGLVGLELAVNFPERLNKLVLVTPAPADGLRIAPGIHQYHEDQRKDRTDPHALDRLVMESMLSAARPYPKEEMVALNKTYIEVSEGHFEHCWDSMLNCNYGDKLSSIMVPTFMIAAQCDLLLPANLMDYQRLANATLHVFSRVSHSAPREIPLELANVIMDFFEHGVVTALTLKSRMNILEGKTEVHTQADHDLIVEEKMSQLESDGSDMQKVAV